MKSQVCFKWLALLSVAVPLSMCDARQTEPPVDAYGRPVLDGHGNPIFYTGPGELKTAQHPTEPALASFTSPSTQTASATPNAGAAHGGNDGSLIFGIYGSQIGRAGIVPIQTENGLELFVSGTSAGRFGLNDFWYALRYDSATTNYQQVFVHPPYGNSDFYWNNPQLVRMMSANVIGNEAPELVVALTDGRICLYDPVTKKRLSEVHIGKGIRAFSTMDIDSDGLDEMLVVSESGLSVHGPYGGQLWKVACGAGEDLVVAQMDADPSLEVALNSGYVVDIASRSVQWTNAGSFGNHLRAADIDQDGNAELIADLSWNGIVAYDVETREIQWTYADASYVGTIELIDLLGDSGLELVYADNYYGNIHVLSLSSSNAVEEWKVTNPQSGATRIVVADADGDGAAELIWGSGANTSSGQRLTVLELSTRLIEWQSVDLEGPFVSAVLGDLDGDGINEIVTGSPESDGGYSSGRIVVIDSQTFRLRGISQPICDDRSALGLRDLKLQDLDGDGRSEILVGADTSYRATVEVYGFESGTFSRKGVVSEEFHGSYRQVAAADVDGNGDLEIITGSGSAWGSSQGAFLTIFDYPGGSRLWRSFDLGAYSDGVSSLQVADFDNDERMDACVTVNGTTFVFDLQQGFQVFRLSGSHSCAAAKPDGGFYIGDNNGWIFEVWPDGTNGYKSYAVANSWKVDSSPIKGLTIGPEGALLISTRGEILLQPAGAQTNAGAVEVAGNVGTSSWLAGTNGARIMSSLTYGVGSFFVVPRTNATVPIDLWQSWETFLEDSDEKRVVFDCDSPHPELEIYFEISGTAIHGIDYTVSGATNISNNLWMVRMSSPAAETEVRFTSLSDDLIEGDETVVVNLVSSDGYKPGSSPKVTLTLNDSVVEVTVEASDYDANELRTRGKVNSGEFTFTRTKDFSGPLVVNFEIDGSAKNGVDYRKIGKRVTFRAGEHTVKLPVIPLRDGIAEGEEHVEINLAQGEGYSVGGSSYAELTIVDEAPHIYLNEGSMTRRGPYVLLIRDGGHRNPLMLELLISKETQGHVKIWSERVAFRGNRDSVEHLIRGNWTEPSTVRIWIVKSRHFSSSEWPLEFQTPAMRR